MSRLPTYCLDSSAIIDWHERYYPPRNFPQLVDRVDEIMQEGRVLISEEVWVEIDSKDAAAKEWCEPRLGDLVVPTDLDVVKQVQAILTSHPKLVGALKNRSGADPFVIAVAMLCDSTVVTGELPGTENRPRIPNVCSDLSVPCISFLDLIKAEHWSF
jgi:hypothetical protein